MFPTFFIPASASAFIYGEIGCGTATLSYTPSTDTPGASAGKLAVAIIRYSAASTVPVTIPAGWEFYLSQAVDSARRDWSPEKCIVAYKVLDGGDIDDTHVFSHVEGAPDTLCGTVFVFSDFHPDVPLDNYQYEGSDCYSNASGYAWKLVGYLGNKNVTIENAYTFDIVSLTGPSGSEDALDPSLALYIGGVPAGVYSDFSSVDTYKTHVLLRKGGTPLRNLLTDEDWNVPCKGWLPYALTTYDLGDSAYSYVTGLKLARLTSTTASGLHYIYKTISLVAGETYTFTTGLFSSAGSYSPYGHIGMGIIPPSGDSNEFGMLCGGYGGAGVVDDPLSTSFTDPQSGREDWWWGGALTTEADALPNFNIRRFSLCFVAQETGEYTLRLYVPSQADNNWSSISHATAVTEYVAWVALMNGVAVGSWMPGTTVPDAWEYALDSPAFLGTAAPIEGSHTSFQVNPNGALPPARLAPYTMQSFCETDDDGIGRASASLFSDSSNECWGRTLLCNRNVFPTIDGVNKKYYVEWTFLSGGLNDDHEFGVGPLHASFPDIESTIEQVYRWKRDGTFEIPVGSISSSAWAASASDKFGVMVDYDNGNVVFYKNGSTIGTATMYTASNIDHSTLPFAFYIAPGNRGSVDWDQFAFDINFSGPFSYLPAGAVAWDAVNEVA